MNVCAGVGHAIGQIELSGVASSFPISRESGDSYFCDCAVNRNYSDGSFIEQSENALFDEDGIKIEKA